MQFDIETRAGKPIHAGRTRLIPFAQTVHLHLPGPSGGLIWSRPTAILVQTPNGEETVLQIRDVTRQAQLTLLGLGFIGALFIWLFNRSGTALLPKMQA